MAANVKSEFNRLRMKLQQEVAKRSRDGAAVVTVGYTAKYALYVHENVEMKWRGFPRDRSIRKDADGTARTGYTATRARGLFWGPNGRAKFLEGPARELRPQMARIIITALARSQTMAQALLQAGLFLQRESQKVVPVDTGHLRASAFTRLEMRR